MHIFMCIYIKNFKNILMMGSNTANKSAWDLELNEYMVKYCIRLKKKNIYFYDFY